MPAITIYYIALIQAIFTIIAFISKKNKAKSGSLLLILLFLCFGDLFISFVKIKFYPFWYLKIPINFFVFAYFPIILLYLRSTLLRLRTLSLSNLIHFIPLIIFISLSLVIEGPNAIFRKQFFMILNEKQLLLYIIYYSMAFLTVLIYTITNLSYINYAKKIIEDKYSYELSEKLLYWFKFLSVLFFLIYALQAFTGFISIILKLDTFNTNMFIVIGFTFFFFSILFFLINSPEIFTEPDNKILDIDNTDQENSYVRSTVPKQTLDICAEKLINIMETKKLYLKNDLDLQDVALEVNYPKHYITQALNIVLKKNFYVFVNEYRVNEFKKRVADKKNSKLTIMSIAYDSGFNSKSTFNSIFKKFTGITPSEYVATISE